MDWAVSIHKERLGSRVRVLVTLTSTAGDVAQIDLYLTSAQAPDWLNNQIQDKIVILNALYAYSDALPTGPLTLTPVVRPVADPDKAAFFDLDAKLARITAVADRAKGLKAGDTSLADLQSAVKEAYRPEYFGV